MRSLLFACLVLWGCGAAPPAPDLAADRARPGVAWSPWSAEKFARAVPKSSTLSSPSRSTITLPGFRSPWGRASASSSPQGTRESAASSATAMARSTSHTTRGGTVVPCSRRTPIQSRRSIPST